VAAAARRGDGFHVHGRQLPLPHRVIEPGTEPVFLLGVADRKPVLTQQDAVLDEQALDLYYCKGCGICASECPCGAIEMRPERI
jgi:ferredoxin